MSAATPLSGDTTSAGRPGCESAHSKLYHAIMTPINFVTFLLSLYLVDCRYQDERARRHAAGRSARGSGPSLLPLWLHRLVFSPERPYEWVDQGQAQQHAQGRQGEGSDPNPNPNPNPNPPNRDDERYYYHTKQRKLMKMEAADAFGLRAPVLLALALAAAVAAWAAGRLGWELVRRAVAVVGWAR
ncbi:hypothetical protein SLS62_005305 [Diatrype stigma]|uniref:Uncharacterized protein n=1 Tax=Diatrype stigma TaxID=117547 RepID=A0AAN9V3C8_9PEZI